MLKSSIKRKAIILIASLFATLLIIGFILHSQASHMQTIDVQGIDLTVLEDGNYIGTFVHGRFTNTLVVHIENNMIVSINIIDDVFGGSVQNVSDEVFRRVIEAQSTEIDAISEATATTNAYLQAIERALTQLRGE